MATLRQEIRLFLAALARAETAVIRIELDGRLQDDPHEFDQIQKIRKSISGARIRISYSLLGSVYLAQSQDPIVAGQMRDERYRLNRVVQRLQGSRSLYDATELGNLFDSYVYAANAVGGGSQRFP